MKPQVLKKRMPDIKKTFAKEPPQLICKKCRNILAIPDTPDKRFIRCPECNTLVKVKSRKKQAKGLSKVFYILLFTSLCFIFYKFLPYLNNKEIAYPKRTFRQENRHELESIPLEIWDHCKYMTKEGKWVLDMSSEYWCTLSVEEQIQYAKAYQKEYAKKNGLELDKTIDTIEMRLIPPGRFWMGSPEEEKIRDKDEIRHRVLITKPYYIGKYEITQKQWASMGKSFWDSVCFKQAGTDAPVEKISWLAAKFFHPELDLPTEAQWEYACRAGVYGMSYKGDFAILGKKNSPGLDQIAWYGGNSGVSYPEAAGSSQWNEKQYPHDRAGTHPVGKKQPNAFGLYDMLGNVWEWCLDYKGISSYREDNAFDPVCQHGFYRVIRGGSWSDDAEDCRSARRFANYPQFSEDYIGFRVVKNIQ
ncbi:MAG: formylglycine-generating enzyme family protein [Candidatus Brocadiae bacterium]|nr:formylglycine-generating enzyme family protein [Candidatus Brocadiia bacterium]